MAKVHKAHKSNKKYSFQRSKKTIIAWIVGIVVAIAAIAIGVTVYNNSRMSEFTVNAPADASLNNIADNWQVLATHTDKVFNEFSMYYPEGMDENGATMLTFYGSQYADRVSIYIKPTYFYSEITNDGLAVRPNIFNVDLGKLFSGEINMNTTDIAMQAGNDNCLIYVEVYDVDSVDDSVMPLVIAELEAIIAEGPVGGVVPAVEGAEDPAAEPTEAPAAEPTEAPAAE